MLELWVGLSSLHQPSDVGPGARGWGVCISGILLVQQRAGLAVPPAPAVVLGPSPGAAVDPQDSAGCWASASTRL